MAKELNNIKKKSCLESLKTGIQQNQDHGINN